MRHTLLPLRERILLRREYHVRIAIVFLFLLSLALIVGISSLIPVFFKARLAEKEARNLVGQMEAEKSNDVIVNIQNDILRSTALLNSLNKQSGNPIISDIIDQVLRVRGKNRFTGFTASIVSTSTYSMNIQGFALSRNDLIQFKNDFENSYPGSKVELPVSELAKSSNFQFSLQLKKKLP